jgi:putative transposase
MLSRRRYKYEEQEQLISLINEIRCDHPRMSARDIYLKLHPACMGRDQLEVTRVNQVFVSDITYFDLGSDTLYLTFIMDLYNREIVGYSESDNLRTENTTIPALYRVIKERGKANLKGAIMHSDGGGQYYCNEFKALTKEMGMINSMTEEKVYENAHAERLNGVIKNNYLYPYGPTNRTSLKRMLDNHIKL